nr:unnamed protein product [Callosobruchus analis]
MKRNCSSSDSDTDTSNSDSSTSSPSLQTSSDLDEAKKEVNVAGILREDPTLQKKNMGQEIIGELAVCWNNYLSQGVDKKTWKKVLESSSIPANCTMVQGHMLNCEDHAMFSSAELKKNSFLHDV